MKTTAILRLPDGRTITGRLETSRPSQTRKVDWIGPIDLLTHPLEETDSYTLEVYCENQAKLRNANWRVARQGTWEIPI